MPRFAFDNSYARELPGFYAPCQPRPVSAPRLLFLNRALGEELQLDLDDADENSRAALFAGNALPDGAAPIAQAYAGHQFGGFSPQLGDGRALLIGEVIDRHGRRRDIALKGSGRTPFSRGGDGKAAVGPMLREVMMGEAMHALGIPTTRALAVVATGEPVQRQTPLPGAVLTRVAASHLRVGTFEYFAAQGDFARVRQLADYAIARHDPGVAASATPYLDFLRAVMGRQAALIARWVQVGFIHGVMNTDNMSIAGETIDYGPCAFLEAYAPRQAFSSIDSQGRYAYGNQAQIAQWNLARLAETLLPLLDPDEERAVARATEAIGEFPALFRQHWLAGMRDKLGLNRTAPDAADSELVSDWLALLEAGKIDFTLAFRRLADAAEGRAETLRALFADTAALDVWLARWHGRCRADDDGAAAEAPARRAARMRQANPWLIPRNHRVEEVLAAASDHDDLAPFNALLAALGAPCDETPAHAPWAEPASAAFTSDYRTFCGT